MSWFSKTDRDTPKVSSSSSTRTTKITSAGGNILKTTTVVSSQQRYSSGSSELFTKSGLQESFSEARSMLNIPSFRMTDTGNSFRITDDDHLSRFAVGRSSLRTARSAFGDPIHEYKPRTTLNSSSFNRPTRLNLNAKPLTSQNLVQPTRLPTYYLNPNNPNPSSIPSQNNANIPFNNELDTEWKVQVKKTGLFYDDPRTTKVPTYATHSKQRGCVLLINNIDFEGDRRRLGADADQGCITELFKQMGFKIKTHANKSKVQMEKIIRDFATSSDMKNVDICITVVMSHGEGTGGETHIETMRGGTVSTEWVVQQFSSTNSKHLIKKPKIFIFQCCRGNETEVESDSKPFQAPRARILEDILICYATVPGFVSYRDPKRGTWYIQGMCKVFMEHAHDTHVEDLLKIVDEKLSQLPHKQRQTKHVIENITTKKDLPRYTAHEPRLFLHSAECNRRKTSGNGSTDTSATTVQHDASKFQDPKKYTNEKNKNTNQEKKGRCTII